MKDFDVIIVGGGHNGLACGAVLAREDFSVLVVERNLWLGGCVATREVTLPGFRHDMYGSSHVWIHLNEEFNKLKSELAQYGLEYIWADNHITGHPNHVGPGMIVYKDINKTVASIARYSEKDAQRYREIYDGFLEIKEGVIANMFTSPGPPSMMTAVMENSEAGLEMLRNYRLSPKAFVKENFKDPHVQAFILGWAMAPQLWPFQEGGGQSFYVMIPAIHYFGESIPRGGTDALPNALAQYIEARGGKVMTNATVDKFIISNNECKGVRLANGREFTASKAVVTSLDPKQTFLRLIDPDHLSPKFLRMVHNFSFGKVSIVRVHYALNEAPQFKNGTDMSKTPFQRIFGTMEDIEQQYAELGRNIPSKNPFLWTACWTVKDPSRAPDGKHTLIMDTFVSNKLPDGGRWTDELAKEYVDAVMLPKLQEYTTNMGRENILGEYIDHAESLAQDNWSLVNGTTTGGERTMTQSGYFRPFPGYSQYRSPIEKLWMTGPSTHPGAGITAMGTVTAVEMLKSFGMRDEDDEFDF
ncbi:MAG: NAD(P)/FAD-dependent oxidoreductase [Chloroflexi bacterium]|nr:NAD(P)/FAD-dependent oxidoreductase [Chloroflexota bacterium]